MVTSCPSVTERYYTKFYYKYADMPDEDVCVLVHSNKVCIITLTPNHRAFKYGPIKSIRYLAETGGKKVGDVHGKRKLQAIKTKVGMPLCEVTAGDGTLFTIDCPVRGKLCELNDKFDTDLTLLDRMPETNGYIAVILHQFCKEKDVCNYLLSEEQYLNGESLPLSKNLKEKNNREQGKEPEEKSTTEDKEDGEIDAEDSSRNKRKDNTPVSEADTATDMKRTRTDED